MRRRLLLGADLFWVAISPVAALFIREGWPIRAEGLWTAVGFGLIGAVVAAIIFPLGGLNRSLWRYTSLNDVLRLIMAVTVTLLLSVFVGFAFWRLEDVARSLPLIQWLFLVAAMVGTRVAVRIWRERAKLVSETLTAPSDGPEHVLIVGVGPLAELYLRAVDEFAAGRILIEGFLASGDELKGRLLRSHEVLGSPQDVGRVVRDLEVRGVNVSQIIVAEPFDRVSPQARESLSSFENATDVGVRWLAETLGLNPATPASNSSSLAPIEAPSLTFDASPGANYRALKRVIDLVGSAVLICILSPLAFLVSVVVALDLGPPIVFWQKRPGRCGRPFKLYKFRTMRAAHDNSGNRVPDEHRSSAVGRFLRRSRLDELPQLYNILVGEMSFVGPRPLLRWEQQSPQGPSRLLARPGLTGWAQVNGGTKLSAEDKIVLDIWYIQNQSLALDLQIAVRTIAFLLRGEHVNVAALTAAVMKLPSAHGPSPSALSP
jgi:lipopolysaccharide/colanic/teichoic acid biosynthesis glycosyltransferase